MPSLPPGWTDRPCKFAEECSGYNMQCFKLDTKAKYGKCIPSQCNYDNDCPNWCSCIENKCVIDPCSHQNPCKPGLKCVKGFLYQLKGRQTIKTYFSREKKNQIIFY